MPLSGKRVLLNTEPCPALRKTLGQFEAPDIPDPAAIGTEEDLLATAVKAGFVVMGTVDSQLGLLGTVTHHHPDVEIVAVLGVFPFVGSEDDGFAVRRPTGVFDDVFGIVGELSLATTVEVHDPELRDFGVDGWTQEKDLFTVGRDLRIEAGTELSRQAAVDIDGPDLQNFAIGREAGVGDLGTIGRDRGGEILSEATRDSGPAGTDEAAPPERELTAHAVGTVDDGGSIGNECGEEREVVFGTEPGGGFGTDFLFPDLGLDFTVFITKDGVDEDIVGGRKDRTAIIEVFRFIVGHLDKASDHFGRLQGVEIGNGIVSFQGGLQPRGSLFNGKFDERYRDGVDPVELDLVMCLVFGFIGNIHGAIGKFVEFRRKFVGSDSRKIEDPGEFAFADGTAIEEDLGLGRCHRDFDQFG